MQGRIVIPKTEQWKAITTEAFLVPGWTPARQRLNFYGLEVEANWEEWVAFAEMILALDAQLNEGAFRDGQ